MDENQATNGSEPEAQTPEIGTIVTYYADLDTNRGMKSTDDAQPFAALVVGAVGDGTINLVVFDHRGGIHPMQSVSLDKLEPPAEPEATADEPAADDVSDTDPDAPPLPLMGETAGAPVTA
jgi:hypothetical protein